MFHTPNAALAAHQALAALNLLAIELRATCSPQRLRTLADMAWEHVAVLVEDTPAAVIPFLWSYGGGLKWETMVRTRRPTMMGTPHHATSTRPTARAMSVISVSNVASGPPR